MTTTTDEVTHLRALLAERDARLDEAKRWLEYAATHRGFDFDFDTWAAGVEKVLGRPPKYLYVVNQRAEKAEALLAEQTARAERAEADYRRVLSERAEANQLAGRCAQQRDAALAANAEMRAALVEIIARGQEQRGTGRMIETAEAILSRPDLGAGMVLVPREMVARARDAHLSAIAALMALDLYDGVVIDELRASIADLDAMLKKGGG